MKLRETIAAGAVFASVCCGSFAAPGGVDRPTPPPCCADGKCYSRPETYGVYSTRWRRWPLEQFAATGPTTPQQVLPIVEQPKPIDEDQQAPPPTQPKEPPARREAGGSATGPAGPTDRTPGSGPPPEGEPAGPRGFGQPLPLYQPQPPATTPLNEGEPTSDADPPPSLPFGPQPVQVNLPIRAASQPMPLPIQQPLPKAGHTPSDDPPPNLPTALASLSG